LLAKIRLGEDTSLELKSVRFKGDRVTAPERDDLADVLTGMANTRDGVIVLGVNDKTREIEGVPVAMLEQVERYVFEICTDTVKPPILFRSYRMELPDSSGTPKAVLKVEVPRSLFVHKSPRGYFHRQGSSTREMPPDYLARLFQQRSQSRMIRFDEQAVPTAPMDCLEEELWTKFKTPLSAVRTEEFLLKTKLATLDDNGTPHPTVSGILLASRSPHDFIPNAFIQTVCYRGDERNAAYQLDAKDLTGPLDIQIQEACEFIERNMRVYAIKAPNRIETPQFSMNAVFEAVVNAVAHRDYSIYGSKIRIHLFADRLEIFSPGMIANTLTLDSLSERQSARNELLTSLLARCPMNVGAAESKRTFIMDKRGEGVPIIITDSEKLSGIRPKYELLDDAELKLTIFAALPPPEQE
jgi:ATP-dependent DNA helicase RecG